MNKWRTWIKLIILLVLFVLIILFNSFLPSLVQLSPDELKIWDKVYKIFLIAIVCWSLIISLRGLRRVFQRNFHVNEDDNLRYRKFFTQYNILEKVLTFLIVFVGLAASLMLFDGVKQLGLSLFASAGITSLIVGFAAQKIIGSALAGIQIAFTQPIRIDDVLVVEGEWGKVEEINLTYVVIKIWDKRRLVLPSTYFIDKPFQNWTRTSAEIVGTVFLYTDYHVPFDALREELEKVVKESPYWDGQVVQLAVTNATERVVESRILLSAKDSPSAWELRVFVREKMIDFLQQNYPDSLPRTRVEMVPPKGSDS